MLWFIEVRVGSFEFVDECWGMFLCVYVCVCVCVGCVSVSWLGPPDEALRPGRHCIFKAEEGCSGPCVCV